MSADRHDRFQDDGSGMRFETLTTAQLDVVRSLLHHLGTVQETLGVAMHRLSEYARIPTPATDAELKLAISELVAAVDPLRDDGGGS